MSDVNLSIVQGRLTRMPELRKTNSGVSVCDVQLASNRYVKRKDKEKEYDQFTTFVRVTLWNQMAERYAEQLKTGDQVIITGQLVDDNYEKDGQKTSGRLKIDNVSQVSIVARAKEKTEKESTEPPEV